MIKLTYAVRRPFLAAPKPEKCSKVAATRPPMPSAARSSKPACRPGKDAWCHSSSAPTSSALNTANNTMRQPHRPLAIETRAAITPNAAACTSLSQGDGTSPTAIGCAPPTNSPTTMISASSQQMARACSANFRLKTRMLTGDFFKGIGRGYALPRTALMVLASVRIIAAIFGPGSRGLVRGSRRTARLA